MLSPYLPCQDQDYICGQNYDVVDLGGLRYGDDHVEVEGDTGGGEKFGRSILEVGELC